MRFSLIGPAWPYRGGISHYNTSLASELASSHEVEIVNYTRLYPEFLFPGKTQYDESENAHRFDSVRLIDSINPFTWVKAGFHIARSKPDAVVVQWWHPYFAPAIFKVCSIIRVFSRARVIFLCHNVKPHEKSWLDRILTALAFSVASGFVVHSSDDLNNLRKMKKAARAVVNPLPIFDFFKSGEMSKEAARRQVDEDAGPLLLFFGYIRPYKGLKFLIESMKEIRRSIPARLLVVGEFYEDKAPYIDQVRESGLSDSISFIDRYVSNEEVQQYFSACDLVVLPYTTASQSGIAQIAITFERPMIVTRAGGLPEVVLEGKTGFVVPPADPEAIAEKVVTFFSGGPAGDMTPWFESEKKRFSWASMVEKITGLVRELSGAGDE